MADFLRKRRNYQKRWEPSIHQLFVNNVAKRQGLDKNVTQKLWKRDCDCGKSFPLVSA